MADIPTLATLQTQIENDLRSELGITRTWIGKVFLRVLATVQAAKLKLFYLQVGQLQKNIYVDTADSEANGGTLERFGRVKLGRNPNPAQAGVYTLNITGVTGGTVLKGTVYKSAATSTSPDKMFEVTTTVVLVGATGTIEVRALEGGSASVLVATDELESTIPIANVDSLAVVASVDTSPVDAEDLETYRRLVVESFQLEPQGGAATDYRIWAADAAGVRTVYPYKKNAAYTTVQVFVEATPESSAPGQPDGVAPASMLSDVADVIELDPDVTKPMNERGRRPVQVVLETLSVIPVAVTVSIADLSDKTAGTINAITAALTDYFYNVRPYIAGADGENKNDTIYQSQVIGAIYSAVPTTVNFSNITITIGGITYTQYQFGNIPGTYGNYPYLFSLLTP
jgi:uncharacterized phage protein gp47/JayE